VIKAKHKIESLEQKFREEMIKGRTKLEYDRNVLLSREDQLRQSMADLEQSAVAGTEKDIQYAMLEREASTAKDEYDTLLAAVKEVTINTNTASTTTSSTSTNGR